jgi:hypothetical protein
MTECTDSSLEQLVKSLVEVHTVDPELSELLGSEVPHRADGTVDFSIRFHEGFRAALAPHTASFGTKIDLDTRAFIMANMVDALGHAVVLRRPRGLSLARGKSRILQGNSCVSCLLISHCGSLINSAHAQRSGLARLILGSGQLWCVHRCRIHSWLVGNPSVIRSCPYGPFIGTNLPKVRKNVMRDYQPIWRIRSRMSPP